jgi:hypothetical protein
VQQIAERQGISASRLIRRAILAYLRSLPLELLFTRRLELRELFKQLRLFALTYRVAGVDVTARREAMVQTLTERIDEVSGLIREGKVAKTKMLRQYQLLGYLCDILNAVLENVATDELLRRMKKCEEFSGIGETESVDRETAEETREGAQTTGREAAE